VKFQYADDFSVEKIERIANAAKQKFVSMPGLRSKAFMFDEAAKTAINFYVWESPDAAREFFTPELVEGVTGLYGVRPEIQFVEIATLVDNANESHTAPTAANV
jgi:hypothetical protein